MSLCTCIATPPFHVTVMLSFDPSDARDCLCGLECWLTDTESISKSYARLHQRRDAGRQVFDSQGYPCALQHWKVYERSIKSTDCLIDVLLSMKHHMISTIDVQIPKAKTAPSYPGHSAEGFLSLPSPVLEGSTCTVQALVLATVTPPFLLS